MIDLDWIKKWAEAHDFGMTVRGDSPQIIIVGTTHFYNVFKNQQERLVDKLRPDFILHSLSG